MRQGGHVGLTIARLSDLEGVRRPEQPLYPTVPFTLLPDALFEPDRWKPLIWGKSQLHDHITLLEPRTVVKLLRRLSCFTELHDAAIFSLQDKRPTAGSMRKGRSPSYSLNRILRMRSGICLAAKFRTFLPWTESKKMPADALSRLV